MTDETPRLDLAVHARARRGDVAVIVGTGEVRTYGEMEERSNRLAHLFRHEGLGVGDHLAILMENRAAFLETAWAAQRAGLYYTALNSHLHHVEVQYILDDCGASVLVTTSAMATSVAALDLTRVPVRLSVGGGIEGFRDYEAEMAAYPSTPIDDECEGREMLYSSGTTGRPKGVRKELPAYADRRPVGGTRADRAGPRAPGGGNRLGVPLPGPAVSLCAARLLLVDAARRGDRGRDGALRPRRVPCAHRTPSGDARPVRADHVRADAPAARG